jgi:hypothetical protein
LQDIAKKDHARKVAAMREWNEEELRMLDKAVAKFPQVRWKATLSVKPRSRLMQKHKGTRRQ